MHWVVAEDVPVPSTMGKELAFEPYNYFDYNQLKNLPTNQYVYAASSPRARLELASGQPRGNCTLALWRRDSTETSAAVPPRRRRGTAAVPP